jgi:hypothetical protein
MTQPTGDVDREWYAKRWEAHDDIRLKLSGLVGQGCGERIFDRETRLVYDQRRDPRLSVAGQDADRQGEFPPVESSGTLEFAIPIGRLRINGERRVEGLPIVLGLSC